MAREGRDRLSWERFDGGINQKPELALPGQVLDARNVWAPDGFAEGRPGQNVLADFPGESEALSGSITDATDNLDGTWTWEITCPAVTLTQGLLINGTPPQLTPEDPAVEVNCTLVSGPPDSLGPLTENALRVYTATAPSAGSGASLTPQFTYTYQQFTRIHLLAQAHVHGLIPVVLVYDAFDETTQTVLGFIFVYGTASNLGDAVPDYAAVNLTATYKYISTMAVVPDFGLIYITYNQTLYVATTRDATPGFVRLATVNTDPLFVGPRTDEFTPPFSVDVIPQLAEPPRAGVIYYFLGMIFATQIVDRPYDVVWTAPAILGGYNVWPEINFETLDDEFGLPPMCLASLHEQLVVYKRRSISIFVAMGPNSVTGLAEFSPTRVVSGVGCESQHGIAEVRGRHMFPAEDGIYAFDGTPGVQKLSGPIDAFYRQINRNARIRCSAVHWPEKHCVLWAFAVTTLPQTAASLGQVIVFDYDAPNGGAWWVWDFTGGISFAARLETAAPTPQVCLADARTITSLVGPVGAPVTQDADVAAYILTHRQAEPALLVRSAREIYLEQTNHIDSVDVQILADDDYSDEVDSHTLDFTSDNDVLWNGTMWGQSTWQPHKRRARFAGALATGKHFQLKISATVAKMTDRAWKLIRAALFLDTLRRP